jgi:hypothetical protein
VPSDKNHDSAVRRPVAEIKHDGFRIIARKTGRQSVRRPFRDGSIISMKAELI